MLVRTDETNLMRRVRLVDSSSVALTGIAYNNGSLSVAYLRPSDTSWQSITLVSGTVGTYLANSWVEVGQGVYQVCWPDAVVVSGGETLVRVTYGSNNPQFDSIQAVLLSSTPISPLAAADVQRVNGTTITAFYNESISATVAVYDSADAAVNLNGKTLKVCIERNDGTDLFTTTSVTVSGTSSNNATFTYSTAATSTIDTHKWSLRDTADGDRVLAYGPFVVTPAAYDD